VKGDERLRLFCALLLPPAAVDDVVVWQAGHLAATGKDLRIVPAGNLHITLAFLGSVRAARAGHVVDALREACAGAERPVFTAHRYRETRSVAMIALSDEGGRGQVVAERVFDSLEARELYEREQRKWLAHVTVARFRSRPGLRPSVLDLGEVIPSDAAVMISRLRPGGAQYEIFESVSLGG
jgi:2'-5' RNA ligase